VLSLDEPYAEVTKQMSFAPVKIELGVGATPSTPFALSALLLFTAATILFRLSHFYFFRSTRSISSLLGAGSAIGSGLQFRST
jgi:hypothetical protein